MRVELAMCEKTLLQEIGNKQFKRNDVALTYAMAMASSERDRIDWAKVNHAIIWRWSLSALTYIKQRAWKLMLERAARPQPSEEKSDAPNSR